MNPMGNKVHAIVDGVISRQSTSSLGGISLYMRGVDGNEYYYAHLSRYASGTGQRVKAGELIAFNGATGNAAWTGPHVHFEVHPGGGSPVNPYPPSRPPAANPTHLPRGRPPAPVRGAVDNPEHPREGPAG